MKVFQILSCTFLVLAINMACSGKKVNYDYDQNADFTQYKTYSYQATSPAQNQLVDQRIVAALDSELSKQGIRKVDSNSDLVATYHASTEQQKSFNTTTYGYGGGGPGMRRRGGMGMGMGSSTTTERDYTVGTLVVDLYEAGKKQLVFRGTAEGTLSDNPDKNTKSINDSMKKIFEKYPPEGN